MTFVIRWISRTDLHTAIHQESWPPAWRATHVHGNVHAKATCALRAHTHPHTYFLSRCSCVHTHRKLPWSLLICTCMAISRSTEAHHKAAMLAGETKEETATRKLEIMTSTFVSRTAITQPAHSLVSLWRKQNYLLERCLYCDLTCRERRGAAPAFPCFISLTLIPCYWKHRHHHTHHHGCWVHWSQPWLGGWKQKPANKDSSKLQLGSSSIIHTFNTMEMALLMLHGRKFY